MCQIVQNQVPTTISTTDGWRLIFLSEDESDQIKIGNDCYLLQKTNWKWNLVLKIPDSIQEICTEVFRIYNVTNVPPNRLKEY